MKIMKFGRMFVYRILVLFKYFSKYFECFFINIIYSKIYILKGWGYDFVLYVYL